MMANYAPPTATVDESFLPDFNAEDFYTSATQIHFMQGANDASKRYAVYIPAAIGIFGLGTLISDSEEESTHNAPVADVQADGPSPTEEEVHEVIDGIKYRDGLVLEAYRSDTFPADETDNYEDSSSTIEPRVLI
ncbi:hypothetical protein EIP91_008109 [Steccherinum ochraceum]|uniref:Uncharacterized protein n=1 Tax=Steccherinum ochraceum TaxID=92696 RepID=A0A4R0R3A4_9APHY|nr:hypothetical protein EIP91_008109 [Steccherinum ochraceum]